jgi:hypothetical protein
VKVDLVVDVMLRPTDRRALVILKKRGRMTCARLGEELWGRAMGSSSCPFARPAGRVLHRLLSLGLVYRESGSHHTLWGVK